MPTARDALRVLQGSRMVVDELVKINKGGAISKLQRVQHHAIELAKALYDLRDDEVFKSNIDNATKWASSSNSTTSSSSSSSSSPPPSASSTSSASSASNASSSPSSAPAPNTSISQQTQPSSTSPPSSSPSSSTVTFSSSTMESATITTSPPNSSTTSSTSAGGKVDATTEMMKQYTTVSESINEHSVDIKASSSSSSSPSSTSSEHDTATSTTTTTTAGINRAMMREREVPSTPLARMWGFGSLATRMVLGAVADNATQVITGTPASSSGSRISDKNAERLAEALCRMRGAALKLGQILSLQDDGMLPPALAKALERVKQAADYMPRHQLEAQLVDQLGVNWRSHFKSFDEIPIAAASIGQVHKAVLLDGTEVALKIQYPGVADSIESDLSNLKRLVTMTNLLPPGLFIDQIIHVASTELAMECDYLLEAESQSKYREFILSDKDLNRFADVPEVIPSLSTKRILTSRFVHGESIDKAMNLPQQTRDSIARTILIMTIRELFHLRFIQSDPNFGNFLYDKSCHRINLVDFGAARAYPKSFVDGYMHLVWAAANRDRDTILRVSREMGFLTGDESEDMTRAHVEAGLVVGEPFISNQPFDFASSKLTKRIGAYGETFLKYRLTPPPTEVYSLHRKLAGAFLLAIKLRANIPCRDILELTYQEYKFDSN